MKRGRENVDVQSLDMMKCLMLLSHKPCLPKNVFECKTCNRQFTSFQALGGHRASHKRRRLMGKKTNEEIKIQSLVVNVKPEPNMHECSICGLKFGMGQALGGHMRRHRADIGESFSLFPVVSKVPMLKRSNSSKRVMWLDLNLTPLENGLDLLFRKIGTQS